MKGFILTLSLLFSCFSFGEYNYRQLMLKEYEDMERIINEKIALSRKAAEQDGEDFEGALGALKEGLSIVFMHPTDGVNNTLLSLLSAEVINYTPFWKVIQDIVSSSLNIFESSSSSTLQKASHLYILENILSYIQHRSLYEGGFHSILKLIAKAEIEIPDAVNNHRFMTAGKAKLHSPSLKAKTMLRKRLKAKKAKERKERLKNKAKASLKRKKSKNKIQREEEKKPEEEEIKEKEKQEEGEETD